MCSQLLIEQKSLRPQKKHLKYFILKIITIENANIHLI